jgi:ERCC4-related helicase/ERCC4-type nuclease
MASADAGADAADYVDHDLLVPGVVERRRYQTDIAEVATAHDTLVCLPTGLGKTTVSLLVTADRLAADAGGKSLFLAPTKPLVEQHATFYREALAIPDEEIVVFTGEVRPDDRAAVWGDARVVIATPQVIENDLVGERISLRDVVHCTFDECHRATGDYAYTYIAERYHADAADPLVTGMSASPGDDEEAIERVCRNLGIDRVEVRTEADEDVAEYVYDTDVNWERVELPEDILAIRDKLQDVISERLTELAELGVTSTTQPDLSQKQMDKIRGRLQSLIDKDDSGGYQGMSIHAEVMKLRRAVELVETQSVESLRRYFERQRNAARSSGASKASQRLVSEPRVKEAMQLAEDFDDLHPKFRRARMLLAETLGIQDGERVIVFTESRDTAETLTEFLGTHFDTRRFVGQGDRDGSEGMTQTQQQETLDAFRAGEFEVLVSTSVAEEGLDVPEVDLVLFYEPVPTAIRSIQRKGRTGRQTEGRVVVFLAEDTRDEAFFWIAQRREEEMEEELRGLKSVAEELNESLTDQGSLAAFATGDEASQNPDSSDADTQSESQDADSGSTEAGGQAGLQDFESAEQAEDTTTAETAQTEDTEPEVAVAKSGSQAEAEVEVVVDQRELDSHIGRDLSTREDVSVRLETLDVGDYVLSDRVAAERKEVADFVDSLVGDDRSLFEQVGDTTRHYDRPVVVLEGEGLYEARNVHPNAIRGALASLAVDYGVSVLRTEDVEATADLLTLLARREQTTRDRAISVHGEKASRTLSEQQEYVVSSLADVGPVTARSLLEHFGSVEAALTADEEALLDVEGIGTVTAERIREVVASDYEP